MADLTVLSSLSPVPIYPSIPGASRSSLFRTYASGAGASRTDLRKEESSTPVNADFGGDARISRVSTRVRPPRIRTKREGSESGSDLSGQSDDEEHNSSTTPTTDEEAPRTESPTSYVTAQSTGWARNQIGFSLNSSSSASLHATPRGRTEQQRHRPTRSRSAPPMKISFSEPVPSTSRTAGPDQSAFDVYKPRRSSTYNSGSSSGYSSPSSSFSAPTYGGLGYGNGYGRARGTELLRPPPPLHRPTTFWRHTTRSGVTASSYSPSSHVIRRSTFVAAGLTFDKPMDDISALGVESRIRSASYEEGVKANVSEVFWEVVVQR